MARRKQEKNKIETTATNESTATAAEQPQTPEPVEEATAAASEATPAEAASEKSEQPKNWGDPYKRIFTCREKGIEMGENRQFKQRVFKFSAKPSDEILAELKENGFTYRAAEKSWTIRADAETRRLTDELAQKWAGSSRVEIQR
jgi:hypothetical protein